MTVNFQAVMPYKRMGSGRRHSLSRDDDSSDTDHEYSLQSYHHLRDETSFGLRRRNISNNAQKNPPSKKGKGEYPHNLSTKAICINFVTVVISTIGLIALVLGYCCLGGAVFQWLEADSEEENVLNDRRLVEALVKQHAAKLYTQLQQDASNQTIDRVSIISDVLDNVSSDAFDVAQNQNWDGMPQGDPLSLDWTLPGAILFSVTTITTIGYGFIAPKTSTGRIICIFYSVFGIPITMLAIANLGLWFARQVRKVHKAISKFRKKKTDESKVAEVRCQSSYH
ncbi:potassium channel subfamily K member 5-like [Watersipora subatra]|uniref:potassium channel subfamily K member 5-like n=1 Tax=Watersipora subatra TaxID=2589382 RepID=UPI00355AED84